jgi:hypothetical protein
MVYLQITLKVAPANRPAVAGVYQRYKAPSLDTIAGAKLKELLVRDEDVEVLHGFDTAERANACLKSRLFTSDVVGALKPLLDAEPDVRIYKGGLMCACRAVDVGGSTLRAAPEEQRVEGVSAGVRP